MWLNIFLVIIGSIKFGISVLKKEEGIFWNKVQRISACDILFFKWNDTTTKQGGFRSIEKHKRTACYKTLRGVEMENFLVNL